MARKSGGENNAFKHGTFAHDPMILPDENGDEFVQLHQDLIEEWKPIGALEEAQSPAVEAKKAAQLRELTSKKLPWMTGWMLVSTKR